MTSTLACGPGFSLLLLQCAAFETAEPVARVYGFVRVLAGFWPSALQSMFCTVPSFGSRAILVMSAGQSFGSKSFGSC